MQTGSSTNPRCWGVLFIGLILLLSGVLPLQAQSSNNKQTIILAARILDIESGSYLRKSAIWVEGERIKAVGPAGTLLKRAPASIQRIDLGDLTVLPGLIDCHTHLLARIPEDDNGYAYNLLIKSDAYRVLEGAANARASVRAGFTTVRDVENEGAGYADVALRDAINQGLIEGPRMQVATRGIAAVGQYHPFGVSPQLTDFPTGAQLISGAEEARRAVREQIAHGADLIKVYADWRYPTLTLRELNVIVEEAHKAHRKVAAHATTVSGIHNAIMAGVDSIEHANGADRANLEKMKAKGIYLVPTLSALDARVAKANESSVQQVWFALKAKNQMMSLARQVGVRIASGSDPSSAERHGRNAAELQSMTRRGLSPLEALRAATVSAADLLGWSDDVGRIKAGQWADLIAVEGDPIQNIAVLHHVRFVMKGGRVMKRQ